MHPIYFKQKKAVVILATQRSGSTLLCSDIINVGGIGTPGEHFTRIQHARNRYAQKHIDRFLTAGNRDHSEYYAITLMCNYLHEFSGWLQGKVIVSPAKELEALQLEAIKTLQERFEHITFVHLERESVFEQSLSRYRASLINVYHLTKDGGIITGGNQGVKSEDTEQPLDLERFLEFSLALCIEKRLLQDVIDKAKIDYYALTYDEVVHNYPDYLYDLVEHVTGEAHREATPEREMRKIISRIRVADDKLWFMKQYGIV